MPLSLQREKELMLLMSFDFSKLLCIFISEKKTCAMMRQRQTKFITVVLLEELLRRLKCHW